MRFRAIVLAALTAGFAEPSMAQSLVQAIPERPRIIVDGYGEVKTPPDLATISYTDRGEGASSDDAVAAMTRINARIETALRGVDPAVQPHTSEVKVTPVKSNDCKEREYDPPQLSAGACAIIGYVATQSVTVRTGAVKDAGTLVGLVGRNGGFDAELSSFTLKDSRPAQRAATAAALANASDKAAAIATAAHIPIGPILTVSTTGRQEVQEIVVTGSREMDSAAPAPPAPVTVALTPQPITTSASVTVTYAIAR